MPPTDTTSVIRIAARSARVDIDGMPGAELRVEGGTVEVQADGTVDVATGSGRVRVVCPDLATVVVSTTSGKVNVRGTVADVRVITQSGTVEVDRTGDADVRTSSGGVRIGASAGTCRVVTRSGTVRVEIAHELHVAAGSSKVDIGSVEVAHIRTVSGTVHVGTVATGRIDASTMSGKVRVRVPAGTAATARLRSRSGRIVNRVAEGEGSTIDVATSSGVIEVASA